MGISDEFEALQRKEFIKNKQNAEKAFEEGKYDEAKKAFNAAANAARKISDSTSGKQSKEKWLQLSKNYFYASEQLNKGKIPAVNKPKEYVQMPAEASERAPETGQEKEENFEKYIEENVITSSTVTWGDIAGLENTKETIKESVVLSLIEGKPEAIKPWKGILLFGPPGTGKTLLAAATAGSLKSTFFNVKVSQMLSKYFGESSKIVSALYNVARKKSPSIIFLDEFDSIAMTRSAEISESSRRVLSTLLSELDGLQDKKSSSYILTMAATNTPWDLDTAVLSRFQKRIYVPLPDLAAVTEMIKLNTQKKGIEFQGDHKEIAQECVSKLFAGRDVSTLCNEAIWTMVRDQNAGLSQLADKSIDDVKSYNLKVRPLARSDFQTSFESIESAVKQRDLMKHEAWAQEYGGYEPNKKKRLELTDHKKQAVEWNKNELLRPIIEKMPNFLEGSDVKPEVFEAAVNIAAEIAREGREGKPVGTAFVIGDSENVMKNSRQLILNPFAGHPAEERMITNPDLRGNIKELSQLDGVFVVSGNGIFEAAGRYLTVDARIATLPKGLGTRHSSVAAMTMATGAIGIVVSQSGGGIMVMKKGRIEGKV
ncbi:MAG: AAA family ATPase [Candidatus Methanoperedens sp.]|nr:AAA family ATPase [Candidatus Methanoperedens sp.]